MGGVLQHHLGHQVPRDGPRLELPRLLPDVAPQLAVVVLRPAVPRQPRLRQLDRAPGDLEPPGLDARRREQPEQHCRIEEHDQSVEGKINENQCRN